MEESDDLYNKEDDREWNKDGEECQADPVGSSIGQGKEQVNSREHHECQGEPGAHSVCFPTHKCVAGDVSYFIIIEMSCHVASLAVVACHIRIIF